MANEDPSTLTRFFVAHPAAAAVASGAIIFGWVLVLDLLRILAAVIGVILAVLVFSLWRPGGLGHRLRAYILRRFPKAD